MYVNINGVGNVRNLYERSSKARLNLFKRNTSDALKDKGENIDNIKFIERMKNVSKYEVRFYAQLRIGKKIFMKQRKVMEEIELWSDDPSPLYATVWIFKNKKTNDFCGVNPISIATYLENEEYFAIVQDIFGCTYISVYAKEIMRLIAEVKIDYDVFDNEKREWIEFSDYAEFQKFYEKYFPELADISANPSERAFMERC